MELLQETFGAKGNLQEALDENNPNLMENLDLEDLKAKLPQIAEELSKLPSYEFMQKLLSDTGCITKMEELSLPESMKDLTLRLCPYVRRRLTLLRIAKNLHFPGGLY